jgi:hypothetical protein
MSNGAAASDMRRPANVALCASARSTRTRFEVGTVIEDVEHTSE